MKNPFSDQPGIMAHFSPPGPKAAGYLMSKKPMVFIIGPVGGAKTTSSGMKMVNIAQVQHPSRIDGVRKCKIVGIRQNYRRMHDTLIPSIQKFFGHHAKWEGQVDGPCTAECKFRFPDPIGRVDLNLEFACFGDQDIESFIRGFEPNAFFLNELDEFPPDCLGLFYQRTGQRAYMHEIGEDPEPIEFSKVFGDLNMPDEDNWVVSDLMESTPEGCEIFIQPSGFSPDAENMHVLRRDNPNYYHDKAAQMKPWQVRRFIEVKPGLSRDGNPVYDEFSDDLHKGPETMRPQPGVPLVIGVDQGLKPAAIIGQRDTDNVFSVFAEANVESGQAVGGYEFGREVGAIMVADFREWCREGGFRVALDPAAFQTNAELKNFAIAFSRGLAEMVGRVAYAACHTNDPNTRIGAVKACLGRNIKGKPGFRVHPRCKVLRRGFVSGYKFLRVQGKTGVFRDRPDKTDPTCDVHDALQYAVLAVMPRLGAGDVQNFRYNPVAAASKRPAVTAAKAIHR